MLKKLKSQSTAVKKISWKLKSACSSKEVATKEQTTTTMTMAALPETKTGTNGTGGEGRGTVGGKARGGHVLQER